MHITHVRPSYRSLHSAMSTSLSSRQHLQKLLLECVIDACRHEGSHDTEPERVLEVQRAAKQFICTPCSTHSTRRLDSGVCGISILTFMPTWSSHILIVTACTARNCNGYMHSAQSSGDHSRGESPSKLSMSLVVKLFSSNRPRRYDT
jgi:hypothetical protein